MWSSVLIVSSLFLKQESHPYLVLLSFRAAPIPWCSFSPAQLLIGKQIRTDIPTPNNHLIPKWAYLDNFQEKDKECKEKQKKDYDERYRTRPLDPLDPNVLVWIRTGHNQTTGQICSPAATPRSYIVTTSDGLGLRRTWSHPTPRSPVQTRFHSGITVRPLNRLTLWC